MKQASGQTVKAAIASQIEQVRAALNKPLYRIYEPLPQSVIAPNIAVSAECNGHCFIVTFHYAHCSRKAAISTVTGTIFYATRPILLVQLQERVVIICS